MAEAQASDSHQTMRAEPGHTVQYRASSSFPLITPAWTSAGPSWPHNSCNYTDGDPPGGGRLVGAVSAEQGRYGTSLLVSWAWTEEMMITPALPVYHSLPFPWAEGLILNVEN